MSAEQAPSTSVAAGLGRENFAALVLTPHVKFLLWIHRARSPWGGGGGAILCTGGRFRRELTLVGPPCWVSLGFQRDSLDDSQLEDL